MNETARKFITSLGFDTFKGDPKANKQIGIGATKFMAQSRYGNLYLLYLSNDVSLS